MAELDQQRNAPAAAGGPMFSRAAWARILPFATYIGFTILAAALEWLGWSPASLRWLYPVKIGAVALLLAFFWRRYTELKGTPPSRMMTMVAIAAGVAVLALWISLSAGWMALGTSAGYDPRTDGRIVWPLALVRIGGAALVVPLMEELFWRSFLMRWIERPDFESVDPTQVRLKSFIITIVLFGFEHNLWLAGIVAGAVYGLLYVRHRALWSPILAHAVTNGLLGIWVVCTGNWSFW